jgi:hypothetical protein
MRATAAVHTASACLSASVRRQAQLPCGHAPARTACCGVTMRMDGRLGASSVAGGVAEGPIVVPRERLNAQHRVTSARGRAGEFGGNPDSGFSNTAGD